MSGPHVHQLLYQMRQEGIITPDTMRPFHRVLWQQAKRELGYFKEKPTPTHRRKARRAKNAIFKKAKSKSRTAE